MKPSQFMDKQIMDLAGSSSTTGGTGAGELLDLMNPRDDQYSHGGSSNSGSGVMTKENILPSYDFQPIRTSGYDNHGSSKNLDGAARSWGSGDSKLGSDNMRYSHTSEPHEQPKLNHEMERDAYDVATVNEVDRTVKKYVDNLLRTLEGLSSRLIQLEGITRHLETSVDELKITVGSNSGSTDGKLRQLENILREVQTGVQVMRDKQDILDAQAQLSKLQHSSKQDQQPPPPPPPPPPENSNPATSHQSYFHPAAPPPPLENSKPAVPQQAPPPPPFFQPPPPPQQSYQPPMPPHHPSYQPPAPPSGSAVPPQPQTQTSLSSAPPQSLLPPNRPPPPTYGAPPTQPSQTPSQPQHHYQLPQYPPHQDDSSSAVHYMPPPPQQPPPFYDSNNQIPFSGYGPQSESGAYPYNSGSPSHYSKQQLPFANSPPLARTSSSSSAGGNYSRLPTAKILPQAAGAIGSGSSSGNKIPVDDVVEKVGTMGFSREQVRAAVRKLTENGQSVDLNVVLDKLTNEGSGGGDMIQPQKGWFGR